MTNLKNRAGINRALTNVQKFMLARHAIEKFKDQDLRALEDEKAALVEEELNKCSENFRSDLDILEKYNGCAEIGTLSIPGAYVEIADRTFKVNEEKTVHRKSLEKHQVPFEIDIHGRSDFKSVKSCYNAEIKYQHNWFLLELKNDVRLPCYANGYRASSHIFIENRINDTDLLNGDYATLIPKNGEPTHFLCVGGDKAGFYSDAFFYAVKDYMIARSERILKERKMQTTMVNLIAATRKFKDIVSAWPEALELVDDMYPLMNDVNKSLVAINTEDRKLLCENMKARGVEAPTMCNA